MLNTYERKLVENHIYNIVRKVLIENKNILEELDDSKEYKYEEKKEEKDSKDIKRKAVIKWLKDPIVDNAPIMKALWNPSSDEEDSKRSYFYKCRDGELNDNGIPYQFSDDEITTLYKIKNQSLK